MKKIELTTRLLVITLFLCVSSCQTIDDLQEAIKDIKEIKKEKEDIHENSKESLAPKKNK